MNQIEEIKEKLDIADVVSEYVQLKSSGRNKFGLCPFHKEKTPSFSVNSELGIFKCFGCQESGDVIAFIEKVESVDFPKALEIAAKKAGVELIKTNSAEYDKNAKEKKLVVRLNTLSATFFNYILVSHEAGKKAKEYANKRGLTKEIIEKFNIGYAPSGYENLKKFLLKKGFHESELIRYGLLVSKGNRVFDKFRSRIMFSIYDEYGDIVGFSGRIIDNNSKAPKYLNSPQTPVYNKSNLVFGLYQAKESIRKEGFVIITEGQMDVISSYKVGVKNTVAPLGTAITDLQLKKLKRYAETFLFAFDNDSAGEAAAFRAFKIASELGVVSKGITIPDVHDVDELIQTDSKKWQKAIDDAQDMIIYLIKRVSKDVDLTTIDGKVKSANLILPVIASVSDSIRKDYYLEELSLYLQIDKSILRKEMIASKSSNQHGEFIKTQSRNVKKDERRKEDYLLAILIQYANKVGRMIKLIEPSLFSEKDDLTLFTKIVEFIEETGGKETKV
ncbi:DNA primase, partial [Candidatus Dojkabacteria bacterium]|nr:DNA primase [Candidatus Dojkabacteria bacterium]